MGKYYSVAKLSDRISETPEGFLICEGVPITRAGDLVYAPFETPVTPGNGNTTISRTVEDIFDPATIASFEGKPVTIEHPSDFVGPDNWRDLAVGVVQNVRPGEGEDADKLLADLLITDSDAIAAVKDKTLREVSCGYEAEYIEIEPGKGKQENIIGNHVALVEAGRCGSECAIFDNKPKELGMTLKDKIMKVVGKSLDEAIPDGGAPEKDAKDAKDGGDIMAQVMSILEAIKNALQPAGADDAAKKAAEAAIETGAKPTEGGEPAKTEPPTIDERLATIEAAVAKLAGIEGGAAVEGAADECKDAATIARAEILAPGIAKTGDVMAKALIACYETNDGKAIIDSLLAGKTFDAAAKSNEMLFVAASEMLKGIRRADLNQRVTLDQLNLASGPMSAEQINAKNAEHYGTKK